MDRRSAKTVFIRCAAVSLLCAAGILALTRVNRAAVSAKPRPQLSADAPETVPPSTAEPGEASQRKAGFAHELLPLADTEFQSSLLRLGSSQVVHILLIGQDERVDSGARSDTMILCTFHKKNNTITLTSFLRDLYVKIPGYGRNRINAAYRFGGTELLNRTLHENFGIEVDGNVQVDFTCFEKIIDCLGGVSLELTEREADFINTHLENSALAAGANVLTGEQALLYARNRHDTDGDFSRTNRQRKLLQVLLQTCKEKKLPEILSLLQEVLPMIETDMAKSDLTAYAISLGPMLSGAEIRTQAIPVEGGFSYETIGGKAVLVPDLKKNRQALTEFLELG